MRKRSVRVLAGLGAAIVAAAAGIGITMASAAGSVTATFGLESSWETGFGGKYTITNGSDQSATWTLQFDLPTGTSVGSFWDADITSAAVAGGTRYTAVGKSWNKTVAPGGSTSFGFNGSGSGRPTNCTINGASCSTGSQPSPTAPPTTGGPSPSVPPTSAPPTTQNPLPSGNTVLGYFVQWGVYQRGYHVKNIDTSGSASKLTHINYAFGNVTNGQCVLGDTYADYDRFYSAAESVDGVADTWDAGALRGSFNQLRKLKQKHPHIKVLFSFGGWTWSGGFGQAAANPTAFANSCYNLLHDSRWNGVFDGIDIDWEYPNACGLSCDSSGPNAYSNLMSALRSRFGGELVTSAITADATPGGKIDAANYGGAASSVDWYNVMTYDFFGAFAPQGPTAPHSPLNCYSGIPQQHFCTEAAIAKLKAKGVPSNKLLVGIGFYGRGWAGVSQSAPGGSASGAAPGTYEQGIEDYKVIANRCPPTGTVGGSSYAFCGGQWWSYDTPGTIGSKMSWARGQSLGGAFFWELSGDTTGGTLITAMKNGLG